MKNERTLGSICAGIGGFDLGFERAGWRSVWQIEINRVNRECLADNFPGARQFGDARHWRQYRLAPVTCIVFGFPCQDISHMGNAARLPRAGLDGARSSLFWICMEVVKSLRPRWVVVENVPALLSSNNGRDFQRVVSAFADSGYLGLARVLDSQYFGVPQRRRRLFMVAGLGCHPPLEFLADATPVEAISWQTGQAQEFRQADAWAAYTLTSPQNRGATSRLNLGSEAFIAESGCRDQNIERQRKNEVDGVPIGLDVENACEALAAGNAVVPQVAQWIAEILNRS